MNAPHPLNIDYSKFVTGLSICAFLLGVLYPLTYYSFFFFNVFEYTELSEIITHIIKDGIVLLLPYIIIYYVGFVYVDKQPTTSEFKISLRNYKKMRVGFWLVFIGLFSFFIWEYIVGKTNLPMLLVYIMSFLYSYIIDTPNTLKTKILTKWGLEVGLFDFMFIALLSITLYVGVVGGLTKANGVKFLHDTKDTYIILDKKDTVKSTPLYYYIGRTNNFVFFFNEQKKFVDIYPQTTISKVSLH